MASRIFEVEAWFKLIWKENMNINLNSETSKDACHPKGVEKINLSPKRHITSKISDINLENSSFEKNLNVFHVCLLV